MKSNNKFLTLSIVLMLLLIPVSFAADDYSIPTAYKDITVLEDGAVSISENITYSIEGTVNGVYREIPHDEEQSVTNISVETPGYYNSLEIIQEHKNTKIKVWLYTDEARTKRVSSKDVQVIYHYTFNKGVNIYNDIAELQYMSWGSDWDSGVDQLTTNIHVPGLDDDTRVWNNPPDFVTESYWTDDNTLHTTVTGIDEHTNFEQRIIIPKTSFKSYDNAKVISIDAKDLIIEDQEKYMENRNFQNELTINSLRLIGLLMLLPLGVYMLWGRETGIDYNKKYEYDLPTNSTPLEVNILAKQEVGFADQMAIHATLLDLINRGYYTIISSNDTDTILSVKQKNMENLKSYEKQLTEFLSNFVQDDGNISLKKMGEDEDSQYGEFEKKWIQTAQKEVPQSKIKEYFNDKGLKFMNKVIVIQFLLGLFVIIFYEFYDVQTKLSDIVMYAAGFLILESLILFMLPNTFAGKWTTRGRLYHEQWKSFTNYLTDYSLIREHPPASVQIWGKYLIYATALGKAKEVSDMMNKYFQDIHVDDTYIQGNDLIFFAYYGGINNMTDSFTSASSTDSGSDGIGSAGGGGFGGGGGGTF